MNRADLLESITKETSSITSTHRAAELSKIANKYYKQAPAKDQELLEVCEELIASGNMDLFSIATLWIKRRKTVIELSHFPLVEKWLFQYIRGWGTCDQFCYRVLNPFVDKYPKELFPKVLSWIESDKLYVRRAAPVSLIRIGVGIRVKADIDMVLTVVERLKDDPHPHIQKAIGWLLKYAYQPYPDQVLNYLRENVDKLSRTCYRYALEKVPAETRKEMMAL